MVKISGYRISHDSMRVQHLGSYREIDTTETRRWSSTQLRRILSEGIDPYTAVCHDLCQRCVDLLSVR